MIPWEYKSVELKLLGVDQSLNVLGKDGWDVIHFELVNSIYRVILKRPMAHDHPMLGV